MIPEKRLRIKEHAARVIHELDEFGTVLRIGWELSGAVEDRRKAVNATVHLMECVSASIDLLLSAPDESVKKLASQKEIQRLIDALTDLRPLVKGLVDSYKHGMSLSRDFAAPDSSRVARRA